MPLSDKELDHLEAQIPALATAATRAAHVEALASGYAVMIYEDSALFEVDASGTRRLIKALLPPVPAKRGTRYVLK